MLYILNQLTEDTLTRIIIIITIIIIIIIIITIIIIIIIIIITNSSSSGLSFDSDFRCFQWFHRSKENVKETLPGRLVVKEKNNGTEHVWLRPTRKYFNVIIYVTI